jgi:hypothetical protein
MRGKNPQKLREKPAPRGPSAARRNSSQSGSQANACAAVAKGDLASRGKLNASQRGVGATESADEMDTFRIYYRGNKSKNPTLQKKNL